MSETSREEATTLAYRQATDMTAPPSRCIDSIARDSEQHTEITAARSIQDNVTLMRRGKHKNTSVSWICVIGNHR